jgi:hypothetical protein
LVSRFSAILGLSNSLVECTEIIVVDKADGLLAEMRARRHDRLKALAVAAETDLVIVEGLD